MLIPEFCFLIYTKYWTLSTKHMYYMVKVLNPITLFINAIPSYD